MAGEDPRIAAFLAKYAPPIAAQLREARRILAKRVPRGYEIVYDNYNALAFGFGPTLRASDAVVSIAGYPRWVTLFFLHGATLPDPAGLLQGSGSRVRSVRLDPPDVLLSAPVQALIDAALAPHASAFAAAPSLSSAVKSVSAKQRPRKPAGPDTATPAAGKPRPGAGKRAS